MSAHSASMGTRPVDHYADGAEESGARPEQRPGDTLDTTLVPQPYKDRRMPTAEWVTYSSAANETKNERRPGVVVSRSVSSLGVRGRTRADARGVRTARLASAEPGRSAVPKAHRRTRTARPRTDRHPTRQAAREPPDPARPSHDGEPHPSTPGRSPPPHPRRSQYAITRGQADPERRAGHGPSTGSHAAAIVPNPNGGSHPRRESRTPTII